MEAGITNQHLYTAYRVEATHHGPNPRVSKTLTGTGFVVGKVVDDVQRFTFVTNRHLLDLSWASQQFGGFSLSGVKLWTHAPQDFGPPVLTDPILAAPTIVKYHPDETVDIGGFAFGEGVYVPGDPPRLDNWIGEEVLASRQVFEESIQAGELVFFPGYPAWYDHNGMRPIMRTGAIVSDPRSDYRRVNGDPTPSDGNSQLLFDAFSTSGNSGSPIFVGRRGFRVAAGLQYSGETRDTLLVGINAGHLRDENEQHVGLSRAYKSYEILRFMEVLRSSA